jgi:hypothetical protein
MSRWRALGALAVVTTAAGVVLIAASAGTITGRDQGAAREKGLTLKERNALDIVSVKVTGVEPLGVLVTATFKGNVEQVLGRGHLADGIVALILRPKDPKLAFSGLATFGAGAIGRTARKMRSTDVGILRKGRTVTFFVGGPGFGNVAKVDVKAFAKAPTRRAIRTLQADKPRQDVSPELWEAIGKKIASDEASLPAPTAATSCTELEGMAQALDKLLASARAWETTLIETKQLIQKALPGIEKDFEEKAWGVGLAKALAIGNALVTGPALVLLPPLALGTGVVALGTSEAARTLAEKAQALRDLIRSLKLDLRLADAYLDKVRALVANIRELQGRVDAFSERCKRPQLTPISASFNQDTFTTTYTENATGPDLSYTWSVAIPTDEECAAGFNGNSPSPNQAAWFHKDKSQGGSCNHDGTRTGPRGHPGRVTVVVSNLGWTCKATYDGTQGDGGSLTGVGPSPEPCVAK